MKKERLACDLCCLYERCVAGDVEQTTLCPSLQPRASKHDASTTHIGARLRQARKEKGFSQQVVADRFGIDRASVASWELGTTLPSADKLPALAKFLGLSLDTLFQKES